MGKLPVKDVNIKCAIKFYLKSNLVDGPLTYLHVNIMLLNNRALMTLLLKPRTQGTDPNQLPTLH